MLILFQTIVAFLLVASSTIEGSLIAPAIAPAAPVAYARYAPYNIPPFAASINHNFFGKSLALAAPAVVPHFAPAPAVAPAPALAPAGVVPAFARGILPAPFPYAAPALAGPFAGPVLGAPVAHALPAAPAYPAGLAPAPYAFGAPVAGPLSYAAAAPVAFGGPLPLPVGRSVHAVAPAAVPALPGPVPAVHAPLL